MRPTRVVHYNHTGAIAGAERVLLQALGHLHRHGIESVVLSPAGPLQYEVRQLGVRAEPCFALEARFTSNPVKLVRYLGSFAQSVVALRRQLRAPEPDAVHANSVRAGLVATLAMAFSGVPVVWHVHDTLPRHPLSVVIRAWTFLSRRTSQVAVSASTARSFAGSLFARTLRRKTAVLHNAVDVEEQGIPEEARQALRRELGAEGRYLVGCIGQICARKNQIGMVEMFRDVLRYEPDAVLALAGGTVFAQNAPYEQALRRRVAELGLTDRVRMLGSRRDVAALLQTIDLLVLPSRNEPFAMVLLEAAAAGTPTVAFAVDGVPELLSDRRTAWLVSPGENAQMSRTVVWALRHPEQRQRIGAAARADLRRWRKPAEYAAELARLLQEAARSANRELPAEQTAPATARLEDAA